MGVRAYNRESWGFLKIEGIFYKDNIEYKDIRDYSLLGDHCL